MASNIQAPAVDIIENIHGSTVQHGRHNNRIYLMHLHSEDIDALIAALDNLGAAKGYRKIFAKIPAPSWKHFKSADFVKEAVVPGFFKGTIDGLFISKYFSDQQQERKMDEKLLEIIAGPGAIKPQEASPTPHGPGLDIQQCTPSDTKEMAAIYHQVFKTYPFPIDEPAYIERMMQEDVRYYSLHTNSSIAALASAEIDKKNLNAEMTDFATLPKWRGKGFAAILLSRMEAEIHSCGIKTAYTIARAESYGMNAVFKNNGYTYAGLCQNNTQISGSIQNMTVWYKHL